MGKIYYLMGKSASGYSLAGNQLFGRRIVMSDFFALAAVIEEVTDGFSGFVYSRTLYDEIGRASCRERV